MKLFHSFVIMALFLCGCETATTTSQSTLHGIVIHKEPSETIESWNAGGKEYFVLDVGNLALPGGLRSAAEGVILLPSRRVHAENIAAHEGRMVIVTGSFIEAKKRRTARPGEASLGSPVYRITNGLLQEVGFEVAPSGGGFRVNELSEAR
jgi:hypothetical protein